MPLANGQYSVDFPLVQKLSVTGFEDGSNTNFNADYSVTDELAIIQADPGQLFIINTLQISIIDSGTFAASDYGNIVGGLTNGILTELVSNGVIITNTNQTINNNGELFTTPAFSIIIDYASNERTLFARFAFDAPFVLNGDTNDKVQLRLSDDFTGLTSHEFVAYGIR